MLRLYVFVALLHLYIGGRLVPDLPYGIPAAATAVLMLLASALLVPMAFVRSSAERGAAAERTTWAGLIALGLFSSLLVLTLARDVVLVGMFFANRWLTPAGVDALRSASAAAVPVAALAMTLVGFLNARRRARVRNVRVPIHDLPKALHGFSIAQISDLHVGPTIRRPYVAAIVDAVKRSMPT